MLHRMAVKVYLLYWKGEGQDHIMFLVFNDNLYPWIDQWSWTEIKFVVTQLMKFYSWQWKNVSPKVM